MTDPNANLEAFQAAAALNPTRPRILSLEEQAADMEEVEPTDLELIDGYIENFGGTRAQAVERLRRFDFAAFPAGDS